MKTLIVYASRHGCTKGCAERLKEALGDGTEIAEVRAAGRLDLDAYDTIAVGGSIHAGKIQPRIRKYLERNAATLKAKKLGLFLCCMEEGEGADKEFREAFPADLVEHASATGLFGGEFNFERMNVLERTIIKKIAKTSQSISKVRPEAILDFARRLV